MTAKYKTIIGRAEPIQFVDGAVVYEEVPAKVDSGAYSSSVWATNIKEDENGLSFVLFDETSKFYTGKVITSKKFQKVRVENSFAEAESRYGVNLTVKFCGKKFSTFFTLADRSKKIYPVLIGRKLLKNRFLVDVAIGHPVADEETEEVLGYDSVKSKVRKQ